MHSVDSAGERYVSAGVDEESRGQLPGARGQFAGFSYGLDRLAGQRFQFSRWEAFFAELDVVDSGAGGFGDFLEETVTAGRFVCGQCCAVGDVVQETVFSHQLWRIRQMSLAQVKTN